MFEIKEKFVKYHRKRQKPITGIIIHYISAVNIAPKDPYNIEKIINIFNTYKLSADFLIDLKGNIFRLVPKDNYSYHCGRSAYPFDIENFDNPNNVKTLNEETIGIELIGIYSKPFTKAQYKALTWLTKHLSDEINSPTLLKRIYGHEHVATPLGRKKDPGPSFDWNRYKNSLKKNDILKKSNDISIINKIFDILTKLLSSNTK